MIREPRGNKIKLSKTGIPVGVLGRKKEEPQKEEDEEDEDEEESEEEKGLDFWEKKKKVSFLFSLL